MIQKAPIVEDSTESITMDNIAKAPAPFYGYSQESARSFMDKLDTYLALKNIPTDRWVIIFQSLMHGTARTELENAAALGGRIQLEIAAHQDCDNPDVLLFP